MSRTVVATPAAGAKKKEKPPALVSWQPSEAVDSLDMRGMRVERGGHVGTVRHSYEDARLGPRAFVRFDAGCAGWIDVFELEPYDGANF